MTQSDTQESSPEVSVVVPVLNEASTVEELVKRIEAACAACASSWEIVFVDDGSSDGTCARLISLSAASGALRILRLSRRFGHMAAVSAGLDHARGRAVILMDGDLQDPPELIPEFVAKWRAGADVVYGLRTARREALWQRAATTAFYRILSRITDTEIPEQAGTFGLLDGKFVHAFNALPERSRYFAGLRAWLGGEQAFVPYDRPNRVGSASRVGAANLVRLARSAIISFSKVPLRAAGMLSLASATVLIIVGVGAILVRLFTHLAIPGWATSTALIGFMGFVQSLVLAIISEYIAVIFDEIKGRPLYLVRQEYRYGGIADGAERTLSDRNRQAGA